MPIYMKITDESGAPLFTGNLKAQGRQNWLEVESAQLDPNKGAGRTTGNQRESESGRADAITTIHITRMSDNNSPRLQQYAAQGKVFGCVIEFVRGDTATTYMSIKLKNVMISSYSVGVAQGQPKESFTFDFDSVAFTHLPDEEIPADAFKLKINAYLQGGVRIR